MDHTLDYLRESLSNWLDEDHAARQIYKKLMHEHYRNEEEFSKDLTRQEAAYLDDIMKKEMNYAKDEQDMIRFKELHEVYERLIF